MFLQKKWDVVRKVFGAKWVHEFSCHPFGQARTGHSRERACGRGRLYLSQRMEHLNWPRATIHAHQVNAQSQQAFREKSWG